MQWSMAFPRATVHKQTYGIFVVSKLHVREEVGRGLGKRNSKKLPHGYSDEKSFRSTESCPD